MVDIMQIISLIVNIYISFTENKKRIYMATFLLNLSLCIMYFFNKDLTASLMYIVITTRSFIYIYKDKIKNNIVPITAIILQMLIGIFTMEHYIQIMAVIIPCYSTFYLWYYKSTQKLRIGNIVANTGWAIYNACTGLYIVVIMRIITTLSNVIAYAKNKDVKESN